jgi:hypothetical protein
LVAFVSLVKNIEFMVDPFDVVTADVVSVPSATPALVVPGDDVPCFTEKVMKGDPLKHSKPAQPMKFVEVRFSPVAVSPRASFAA